jgi:hypothetical protein
MGNTPKSSYNNWILENDRYSTIFLKTSCITCAMFYPCLIWKEFLLHKTNDIVFRPSFVCRHKQLEKANDYSVLQWQQFENRNRYKRYYPIRYCSLSKLKTRSCALPRYWKFRAWRFQCRIELEAAKICKIPPLVTNTFGAHDWAIDYFLSFLNIAC